MIDLQNRKKQLIRELFMIAVYDRFVKSQKTINPQLFMITAYDRLLSATIIKNLCNIKI
jgi:ABC-type protease/lipase transport system fused ATPase/permease subunit